MSRFPGRLTCVACALLGAACMAQASDVPSAKGARFEAAAWHAASDELLDTLRGGFDFGGGLAISFGFMRSVTVNGDLVSQVRFTLPDLSHITVDQAKLVSDALAQAHIIQNGVGNTAPVNSTPPSGAPAVSTPGTGSGTNSASTSSISVVSPPDVSTPNVNDPNVSAPSVSPATTVNPVSVAQLNNSLPSAGALTTIVQNSLNNQILQSRTVIDAGVNSLSILRALNIQGALRDALLGALGSH